MERTKYLNKVLDQIRSKEAKEFVKVELENHIRTSKMIYIKSGMTEEHSEQKAISQMGDPSILGKKMNLIHRPKVDWILLFFFITLICLSFLPVSFIEQAGITSFFHSKIVATLLGVVVISLCMLFDYRKLARFWYLFFTASFILMFSIITAGTTINGQPPNLIVAGYGIYSTMTLPLLLIGWASFLSLKSASWWNVTLLFISSMAFYLLSTPNFLLVFMYVVLVFLMVLSSTIKKGQKYTFVILNGILLGSLSLKYINTLHTKSYLIGRINSFLDPEKYIHSSGYIYVKIKELIFSAKWFGNSIKGQEFVLPEFHTDLIFVTLTSRYGLTFSIILICLLLALSVRMAVITVLVKESFGKLLVLGAFTLYSISFTWSILMSFGLVPLVSVSLPFFSHGIIPVVLHSFLIGITLSVYRRKDLVPCAKG